MGESGVFHSHYWDDEDVIVGNGIGEALHVVRVFIDELADCEVKIWGFNGYGKNYEHA